MTAGECRAADAVKLHITGRYYAAAGAGLHPVGSICHVISVTEPCQAIEQHELPYEYASMRRA